MARGKDTGQRFTSVSLLYYVGARHGMRGEGNRGGAGPGIGGSRIPEVPTCLCEVHFLSALAFDIVVKSSGKSAKGRGTPKHLILYSPQPVSKRLWRSHIER